MSKGIFIDGITVDMFRHASLESVEELMNCGDMVDIELPEWIPVREKLPEAKYGESENVLVTLESGGIGFLYFDGGNWCYPDGRTYGNKINPVIAWMPLPEPYKGGDTP